MNGSKSGTLVSDFKLPSVQSFHARKKCAYVAFPHKLLGFGQALQFNRLKLIIRHVI